MGYFQSKVKKANLETSVKDIAKEVVQSESNIIKEATDKIKSVLSEEIVQKIDILKNTSNESRKDDEKSGLELSQDLETSVNDELDTNLSYFIILNQSKKSKSVKNRTTVEKVTRTVNVFKEAQKKGFKTFEEKNYDLEEFKDTLESVKADFIVPTTQKLKGLNVDIPDSNESKKEQRSVKDLIKKFSTPQKSPSHTTLRHKNSAMEKKERYEELNKEIKTREHLDEVKAKIEVMEEVFQKCETIRDF